ncbi:hypothetical protein DWV91_01040 [Enterococcus asini]|nr:hypothetical protein DWV91_01040 [Enterococcus asini]
MYAPGVGVAITAIGTLWGANPDVLAKIVGTLTALTGLAGVFLNISTNQYNKGDESDES